MYLVVFGVNGPTGRLVVGRAVAAGHRVGAATRKPAEYPLGDPVAVAFSKETFGRKK